MNIPPPMPAEQIIIEHLQNAQLNTQCATATAEKISTISPQGDIKYQHIVLGIAVLTFFGIALYLNYKMREEEMRRMRFEGYPI